MGETVVQTTVVNKARMAGYFARKVKWEGRVGAQDYLFIKAGRHVWIEFKDRHKEPNVMQKRNRDKMLAAGADCHVVDNVADGLRILGIAS